MELKHFNISEFDFPGVGKEYPAVKAEGVMKPLFLQMIDNARGIAGVPFKISSGYRPRAYDGKYFSIPDSDHAQGCGCDIIFHNDYEKFQIMRGLITAGFRRIGLSLKNFHIHVGGIESTLPQDVFFEE